MSSADNSGVQQKEAEQFARLFNVVYNSAMLYGGAHPTTINHIDPFFEAVKQYIAGGKTISLVIDRESLFVEDWPVDKIINPRRILSQFGKCGIVSVTFEEGISHKTLEIFLKYAGDLDKAHPMKEIERQIRQSGSRGIRLNYIRYGKITNDQTLVGVDDASMIQPGGFVPATAPTAPPAPGPNHEMSARSLQQLEEILSLARIFEKPEESAAAFSRTALNPDNTDDAVRSLAGLRQSIQDADGPTMDMLLNAVYELKVDLSEAIAVQKETGKLMSTADPLVDEMDQLSVDVIVKLVREEYGQGGVPLRRLAQIIRRMLPETGELKRLLPKLKPELLSAGMSLSEYLELIRTLNVQIESETLAGSLQEAASGIGASVDELVNAIRTQPDDAARLLVMASEIRKGTQDDDEQLSTMLTDYIEKVSTTMALKSNQLSPDDGGKVLREMLEKLELQLVDNLKSYGVEEPILRAVGAMLSQRIDATHDRATAQWISNEIDAKPEISSNELTDQLIKMVSEQGQLERLETPVVDALTARGFDQKQTEVILRRLAHRIAEGKMLKLPSGILSSNNMQFLLNREIKQHHRYETPFTAMIFSAVGVLHNGTARKIKKEEEPVVIPKVFSVVQYILRDIDLVGSLPGSNKSIVLALMTMTENDGAAIACDRIMSKISRLKLKIGDEELQLIVAASIGSPPSETKQEVKEYLTNGYKNHKKIVKELKAKYHLEDEAPPETAN
jgi:hypothetical protein